MTQESLDKSLTAIFKTLDGLDIDTVDKMELLLNLRLLLENVDSYRQSIDILQKNTPSRKAWPKKEEPNNGAIRKH